MAEGNHARFIRLLKELKAKGKTQGEIAESLEVSQQYLSDVKCGQRPVSARFAFMLADKFNIDVRSLYHTRK